jgi:hypothetical protein
VWDGVFIWGLQAHAWERVHADTRVHTQHWCRWCEHQSLRALRVGDVDELIKGRTRELCVCVCVWESACVCACVCVCLCVCSFMFGCFKASMSITEASLWYSLQTKEGVVAPQHLQCPGRPTFSGQKLCLCQIKVLTEGEWNHFYDSSKFVLQLRLPEFAF